MSSKQEAGVKRPGCHDAVSRCSGLTRAREAMTKLYSDEKYKRTFTQKMGAKIEMQVIVICELWVLFFRGSFNIKFTNSYFNALSIYTYNKIICLIIFKKSRNTLNYTVNYLKLQISTFCCLILWFNLNLQIYNPLPNNFGAKYICEIYI